MLFSDFSPACRGRFLSIVPVPESVIVNMAHYCGSVAIAGEEA